MKIKYEYVVVDKSDECVVAENLYSREAAREEKRYLEDNYGLSTKIIQKKYELLSEKVVR